jgi:hypothetical protein
VHDVHFVVIFFFQKRIHIHGLCHQSPKSRAYDVVEANQKRRQKLQQKQGDSHQQPFWDRLSTPGNHAQALAVTSKLSLGDQPVYDLATLRYVGNYFRHQS